MQSAFDRKRKQGDGWGVGWFEKGKPKVFKSPRPIYKDIPLSLPVCQSIQSIQSTGGLARLADRRYPTQTLVGHVRWASNPLKLPKHALIGLAHTQPFQHDEWLFAHNGTLYIPREARAALGPWAKYVKGKNDSEVLFYWLLKGFFSVNAGSTLSPGNITSWAQRLRRSLRRLDAVWDACRHRYPIYPFPYHGLNWVLSNGHMLLAFCYVNPKGFGKSKALCRKGQPYYQLQIQETKDSVLIASEPLTHDKNWKPVPHGQLILVRRTAKGLRVHRKQVL